ncbi:MAG: AI-2E family transporter [Spirochaetaceae bacterium]|nr:AI-2E family transporter [Spirochaetaceae bacterium]
MDPARTRNVLLFIIVVIAVGVALKLMQPVLTPVLVALMLAYLIDPVLVFMDDRLKLPLWLAVPLTGVLSLAVLSGIGLIIAVNLVEFSREFSAFQPRIEQTLKGAMDFVASISGVELAFDPLAELRRLLLSSFEQVAIAAQSVVRGLTSFLLVFFFALLFLSAKHHMTRSFADAFSHPQSSMPAILGQIDRSLRRFIGVKTLISLSVGTATSLILLAFGVRFAVVWGLLTFLLNFIPSIGSLASVAAISLFSFAQFGGGLTPIAVMGCVLAAQILTGSILEPKLLGDALNLSLLVVFVFLFFWGWLWGPIGALLAVPMTAALRIVLANIPATATFTRLMEGRRREPS